MAEGAFRCSLYLSPKVLEASPMYSSSQVRSPHWYQYMAPLWLTIGSLSLVENSRLLMVLPPLKWVWMPYLPQIFLMLSQRPCVWGMTMCPLFLASLVAGWALVVPPSVACLVDSLRLFSTLSKAHLGYLHLVRAFLRCSLSFRSSSGLLHTVGPMEEGVDYTELG